MALPNFHLTEIPEEGISVTCQVHQDELGLTSEEIQVIGELSVSLNIFMIGRRIDVNGMWTGIFRRQCVRCLKEYDETADEPLAAQYECEPPPKRQSKPMANDARKTLERDEELEDSGAENDVYRCTGDCLELDEMLREQIILSIPMQPLCREDCLGLCPTCGEDRNERACGCIEQGGRNPFAILRELQKKSK